MKYTALSCMALTLALASCASPHPENTAGQSADSLARLMVVDRKARLVKVDGVDVTAPVLGSWYLKPGQRELQFRLQHTGATAPGKSLGGGFTPTDRYITEKTVLKAGHDYHLRIDGSLSAPALVINERPGSALKVAASD